jgi:hypothetical protein
MSSPEPGADDSAEATKFLVDALIRSAFALAMLCSFLLQVSSAPLCIF